MVSISINTKANPLATKQVATPTELNKYYARPYSQRSPEKHSAAKVTVLTAPGTSTRKVFSLNGEGQVECSAYDNALHFEHHTCTVGDISDFASLLTDVSRSTSKILIRGEPVAGLPQRTFRRKESFSEPESGCYWAMLDFDDIAMPNAVSAVRPEAIEFLVSKLPIEFHAASYFYQFSSSAGILNSDGAPRKSGVSAHVFFWFDAPITGNRLAAWLRMHCIESGFYTKGLDKGGNPRISYGIDESVLASPVQPHYVALPLIGKGVRCVLAEPDRQALVRKAKDSITLPPLSDNIIGLANAERTKLLRAWQLENGCVPKRSLARSRSGGVVVSEYFAMPFNGSSRTGRVLTRSMVNEKRKADGSTASYATLYFEGESSPGSWYVSKARPTLACRFGGGVEEPLQEFSPSAYAYVRDELQWFDEIVRIEGKLTDAGYLPSFSTFIAARNTLLLAPTSSGKTTAFCDHAFALRCSSTIVYAAQTIALTRQMEQDLKRRGVPVVHYSGFNRFDTIRPGVYVTTNVSLKKILAAIKIQNAEFTLVIDEAHIAIDDFMASNAKNELFEEAMRRAKKTILMTGTLTNLQIRKISESVEESTGRLTSANFQFHEFAPIHRHTLKWAALSNFGRDLAALMRSDAAAKARGQAIPRTVIIAPTSSMEKFRLLLNRFGLQDDAVVASRSEYTQAEIEAARISDKAWLISSPLFAIGLNFEHAPARLWTSFEHLPVDTSVSVPGSHVEPLSAA